MFDPALVAAAHGRVHQTETVASLFSAHFDAVTTVEVAFADCVLGLGVAHACDGEIVALDGEVWRIPADGQPVLAPGELGLPFAVAASGARPLEVPVATGDDLSRIGEVIGAVLVAAGIDDEHHVAAVRLDGRFRDVVMRSEERQQPPYRPLPEVLAREVRFHLPTWEGSLVGFRSPEVGDGTVIPGLHLHGISTDRSSGGHCHAATVVDADLRVWLDDLEILIPHEAVIEAFARTEG